MANRLELYDTPAQNFVKATSRYESSIVYYYVELRKITFETYKLGPTVESPGDRVTVITPGAEYRPDLVSQDVYGSPDFWWRIMQENKIYDIFDFKAGITIRIPVNIFV